MAKINNIVPITWPTVKRAVARWCAVSAGVAERIRPHLARAVARHWASLAGVVVVSIMVVGGLAQIPANPSGKDRGVPAAESNASDGRAPAVAAAADFKPGGVSVVPASAHKLFRNFRKIGYRLEDVRNGAGPVPRVFVKAMPQDIGEVPSVATRKAVFIKTMLPLVLRTNEEIRAIRAKVLALTERKAKGTAVAPADRAWLAAQYDRFGVAMGDRATLLRRVDVVPPSLALAQAAEESGWGSSRFALEGRALFGQRTYRSAPGLVPGKRPEGARFRIKSFDHLLEGVRSYVQNLNTHPAYKRFRTLRAHLRAAGGSGSGFDSLRLVETLHKYSERGAAYIRTIKTIIRVNDLRALDGARLSRAQPVRPDPA